MGAVEKAQGIAILAGAAILGWLAYVNREAIGKFFNDMKGTAGAITAAGQTPTIILNDVRNAGAATGDWISKLLTGETKAERDAAQLDYNNKMNDLYNLVKDFRGDAAANDWYRANYDPTKPLPAAPIVVAPVPNIPVDQRKQDIAALLHTDPSNVTFRYDEQGRVTGGSLTNPPAKIDASVLLNPETSMQYGVKGMAANGLLNLVGGTQIRTQDLVNQINAATTEAHAKVVAIAPRGETWDPSATVNKEGTAALMTTSGGAFQVIDLKGQIPASGSSGAIQGMAARSAAPSATFSAQQASTAAAIDKARGLPAGTTLAALKKG